MSDVAIVVILVCRFVLCAVIRCMSDECSDLCLPFEVGIGVLSACRAVNAWQEVTGFKLVSIKAYSRSVDWFLLRRIGLLTEICCAEVNDRTPSNGF